MSDAGSDHTQLLLIPGLPGDIALSCLARVPRKYHTVLKCVCRGWRDMVCSEAWYAYRKTHGLSEPRIYALCREKDDIVSCFVLDPNSSRRSWKLIQWPASSCLRRYGMGFAALGKKLYLLGGCGWSRDATDEVCCYDVSSNSWSEAASLSTARCYFATEVFDGKIYAIGGFCLRSSDPHSWDTFDAHTKSWESHYDANIVSDIGNSIVLDGKIYIYGSSSPTSSNEYMLFYDPSSKKWQTADADMALGWQGPAVVVGGDLYVLDQRSGNRLMMWQKDNRDWVVVGKPSPLLVKPRCQMIAIGKRIFIVSDGLSTVVFDLDKTGNLERVMLGSSIPGINSDCTVIGCVCVAL